MKDFDKLRTRLRQFGGWRLVWQYASMGVLWTGVKALASCAVSGRSLKSAYPAITKRVDEILVRRYSHILKENKDRHQRSEAESRGEPAVPKIVWSAWLQGMDNAPELVKACLASQKKHMGGYEFRVLDLNSYRQWVELPEYVVKKYRNGQMPPAAFSDLIRLAVLKKYGGVWMDATVLLRAWQEGAGWTVELVYCRCAGECCDIEHPRYASGVLEEFRLSCQLLYLPSVLGFDSAGVP